jgi:NADPH:quinone reductase-like Zn-dependent oxidoreductase
MLHRAKERPKAVSFERRDLTMKAIRIHEYGAPSVLKYEDAPMPEIGGDGLLIRVRAAGVNPIDWKIRKGMMAATRTLQFPAVVGADVAGTVERVGHLVSRFKPGDAVVARVQGAYAEYAAAKTDTVAPAPKSIPLEHAAGLPIAAGTAWTLLFDAAQVVPGQSVLIHAGAGGVGSFAVQFAKLAGLHVIATCSAANVALVKSLGADQVIDYRASNFADEVRNVDLVLDNVGGETLKQSYGVVRKGGLLLAIATMPDDALAKQHGITARFERSAVNGIRLQEIGGLIDTGKVRVIVEKELPLEEAALAHELSEAGRVRGKIILNVSGASS